MTTNVGRVLPERTILTMVRTGVAAILSDLTILDDILDPLDATEKAKARAYYTDHPPTVVLGYPRAETPFPVFAIVLTSDVIKSDFLAYSEQAYLDSEEHKAGERFDRWVEARFTIYVYADHPDLCAWYYRVLRRICNVGIPYLIANKLDNPSIDGAELAPDPRYTPDNVFVRRLTLAVEYDEGWSNQDALWQALNGEPEGFITEETQLNVRRVPDGGKIETYLDEEE